MVRQERLRWKPEEPAPPTTYPDPFDDPRAMIAPMAFRRLPVSMKGSPCAHCVILLQNKLTENPPRTAVKLMVCGGVFVMSVCSPHRVEWMDRFERWLQKR